MMFREKPINKLYAFALAAVFALTLAGCGGGGGSTQAPAEMPDDSQMACEDAGGRWNDNETCTSAADLAAEKLAMEREDIKMKLAAAQTAVGKVDNDSDAAEVSAADAAVAAAKAAIAAAENVPAAEKTANTGTVTALETQLAAAKTARMTAMDDAQKAKDAAMMADAMKLHTGIAAPSGDATTTTAANTALTADQRGAAYNNAAVPDTGVAVDTRIMVGIGTADPVALSEKKDATVAALHGWAGKKYTAEPDDDGMYEAVVYSNVDEPTQGKPFGTRSATATGFEYLLNDEGELVVDSTTDAPTQKRIASPSFDQGAGVKTFKLAESGRRVMIAGSYHGVSGTWYCTPTGDTICASRVAADGFQLGTVASATDNTFTAGATGWNFKPADPNTRVVSTPDAIYASYGWWIHKSEDGSKFTASAFADTKGAVPAAAALDTLNGTATYMGGAAGKYALYSATGGTNDAGHFTARATLKADFTDNSITGTIDQFMGADGMSRDWSVELKEAAVAPTGGITRTGTDQDGNDTVWTMGGTAAAASGEWAGTLYDNDDGGIPKVGTGTFYSEFSTAGKMVGAFGVNKQ